MDVSYRESHWPSIQVAAEHRPDNTGHMNPTGVCATQTRLFPMECAHSPLSARGRCRAFASGLPDEAVTYPSVRAVSGVGLAVLGPADQRQTRPRFQSRGAEAAADKKDKELGRRWLTQGCRQRRGARAPVAPRASATAEWPGAKSPGPWVPGPRWRTRVG